MPKPGPSADSLITDHLADLARSGAAPPTLRARREVLVRFAADAGDPAAAVPADAERWWTGLDALAPASRLSYLSHVRSFYRWTHRMDLRADDPTRRIRGPRLPRRRPRPIAHPIVLSLLASLEDTIGRKARYDGVDLIVVELMSFAGLRCAEVAALTREDCDGRTVRVVGKGSHERDIPIPLALGAAILARPPGPIVRNRRTGAASTPGAVSKRYNRLLAYLEAGGTNHQLRHHYGTALYRETRDLLLVGRLMGHAKPATSAGYIDPDDTATRAVVERIADRLGDASAPRCPVCAT